MDIDEISGDDSRGKIDSPLNGILKKIPNMSGLSVDEKTTMAQKAGHQCLDMLMQTYISLGMGGRFALGAIGAMSGVKYKMKFEVLEPGDEGYDS